MRRRRARRRQQQHHMIVVASLLAVVLSGTTAIVPAAATVAARHRRRDRRRPRSSTAVTKTVISTSAFVSAADGAVGGCGWGRSCCDVEADDATVRRHPREHMRHCDAVPRIRTPITLGGRTRRRRPGQGTTTALLRMGAGFGEAGVATLAGCDDDNAATRTIGRRHGVFVGSCCSASYHHRHRRSPPLAVLYGARSPSPEPEDGLHADFEDSTPNSNVLSTVATLLQETNRKLDRQLEQMDRILALLEENAEIGKSGQQRHSSSSSSSNSGGVDKGNERAMLFIDGTWLYYR